MAALLATLAASAGSCAAAEAPHPGGDDEAVPVEAVSRHGSSAISGLTLTELLAGLGRELAVECLLLSRLAAAAGAAEPATTGTVRAGPDGALHHDPEPTDRLIGALGGPITECQTYARAGLDGWPPSLAGDHELHVFASRADGSRSLEVRSRRADGHAVLCADGLIALDGPLLEVRARTESRATERGRRTVVTGSLAGPTVFVEIDEAAERVEAGGEVTVARTLDDRWQTPAGNHELRVRAESVTRAGRAVPSRWSASGALRRDGAATGGPRVDVARGWIATRVAGPEGTRLLDAAPVE